MLSILLCDDDPLFLNELQATITQILPQEQLSFTAAQKVPIVWKQFNGGLSRMWHL